MNSLDIFQLMHGALWNECIQGHSHFRIVSQLLRSLKERPGLYDTYMTFMGFTLDAHLAGARLSLIKLSDRSKGAVSIEKLHLYARKSLAKDMQEGKIKDASHLLLKRAINECQSLLEQLGDLPGILKGQRDKHFIHLSLEHNGDYDKVYDLFRISLDDLGRLYKAAIAILEEYQHVLPGYSGSLAVHGIESNVEDSLIKMEIAAKHENVPDHLYYARFKLADPK